MLDQERIERHPVPGIDAGPQTRLRLLDRAGPDHPETVRDPVHVGVDRDGGDRVAEDEDAVRGLRADPGQRGQLFERTRYLAAEAPQERPGALADRPRLHVVEAGRADQALDRPRIGPGQRGRVGVTSEELRARDVRVRVPGPLRQDRADEDLERVLGVIAKVRRPPVTGPVERGETVEDPLPVPGIRRGPPLHRTDPAPTRSGSLGTGGAPEDRTVPRPGSERSGSSDAPSPFRSSPTR